jgi:hypothetical protein
MRLGKRWRGDTPNDSAEIGFGDQITVTVPPMGKLSGILGTVKCGQDSRWCLFSENVRISIVSTLDNDDFTYVCIHDPRNGSVISCFVVPKISEDS